MNISYRQMTVPVFERMLCNLAIILDKTVEYAASKNIQESILLDSRLYPDMYPLTKQIQIATDMAKFCVARVTGVEAPKFADDEKTIDELKNRIAQTVAYINSVPEEAFLGAGHKQITLPWMPEKPMQGDFYMLHFALPNVYFHITTAYAILRHNGVPLGKADFIGSI